MRGLIDYAPEMIAEAVERQAKHLLAKTDGESPYYPDHCWDADQWRFDRDAIVTDYLRRFGPDWCRQRGAGK